ncbi:type II CAAX endopeptidase family protein [Lactobacillus sp. ESL0684]|uniref:CPBP family intramembrane glutamic endopeptidase n=1 Tax=Lactobacillus sp. ESL0684 TaxID=2983213 RepID=UPI0023F9B621|nr:type II CAAX endopeptidase family protein [Lactobacillus sp. ESL0684]WEV43986.1 type II CAAX endopeptidase family protein [Lactobacillus sp. ESL0684]
MKKIKFNNESIWSPILFTIVIELAFVIIAILINFLAPSLVATVVYRLARISRTTAVSLIKSLAPPFTVLRYIVAVWFLLWLNKKWLKEPLDFGNWRWSPEVIIIGLFALLSEVYGITTTKIGFNATDLSNLCFTFGPAIFEELWFRGIVLVALVRRMKQQKLGVFWALLITSIIFGLGHVILNDQPNLQELMLQVISAAGGGFLYGALYLRSQNLLLPMLLHFANDFNAWFFNTCWEDLLPLSDVQCVVLELLVNLILSMVLIYKFKTNKELEVE